VRCARVTSPRLILAIYNFNGVPRAAERQTARNATANDLLPPGSFSFLSSFFLSSSSSSFLFS
jgi:hypothetical protein